jgi:hypothetical protein
MPDYKEMYLKLFLASEEEQRGAEKQRHGVWLHAAVKLLNQSLIFSVPHFFDRRFYSGNYKSGKSTVLISN